MNIGHCMVFTLVFVSILKKKSSSSPSCCCLPLDRHLATDDLKSCWLQSSITYAADHVRNVQRYETVAGRCVLESLAASSNRLSSHLNSCWLQSSHPLLIMSGMFQRYQTLAGCHFLMCSEVSCCFYDLKTMSDLKKCVRLVL